MARVIFTTINTVMIMSMVLIRITTVIAVIEILMCNVRRRITIIIAVMTSIKKLS